ncbi:hypothetical protein GX50_00156 [[Emmonsia] crescens]|uniref:Heat shock factor-binding protein 1 n=1 Tax=[Emmonsia] crescens TaxID=73230 RepID=A0A2B7ZVA0_9EURO|nr:hypothetical protein GX50_00156 [Emmonsia crescens]
MSTPSRRPSQLRSNNNNINTDNKRSSIQEVHPHLNGISIIGTKNGTNHLANRLHLNEQQATTAGDESSNQLAQAVDELLDQLQSKFDKVSTEIFGKLDDMARRLDQLEASLANSPEPAATN